jgi:16S rRNA (cytidine1402-2'-O)-methyltransferase
VEASVTGRLILCATPIGNLEDISQRAAKALEAADVIACEDTRRTRKLLQHIGVSPRDLVVYNDANERRRAAELVERIRRGSEVVLVSDAGMPGLSDPGFRLVRECIASELPVGVIPGPTAVVAALAISGLPPGRFVFDGWLPRKAGERRRRVADLATEPRTIVLFASPHRVVEDLRALLEGLGDRPAALVRELTKLHEEVLRGSLSQLIASLTQTPPRGEIVLVVQGALGEHRPAVEPQELARRARALMDSGIERSEALAQTAAEAGVSRRAVFDALVAERD